MAKDVDGGRERWSQRKDGWIEAEERKDEAGAAVDKLKRQIKKKGDACKCRLVFQRAGLKTM